MKRLCIYHKNCADGFGAAWVVRRHAEEVGHEYEFLPAQYGDPPPDVTGMHVLIVDFSWPIEVLLEMEKQAEHLYVLDHHKTAEQELAGLPFAEFDQGHSGAIMTWRFLYGDAEPPELLLYIEDRDLWKWELPESREVNAALRSYPMDFPVWGALMNTLITRLVQEGRGILRYQEQQVDIHASHAIRANIGGHDVPIVNATTLMSEIGNKLCQGEPFAASYFDTADERIYSLRSAEDGLDVSDIAKQYGGGGHKHAAGFKTQKPTYPADSGYPVVQ